MIQGTTKKTQDIARIRATANNSTLGEDKKQ